MGWRDDELLVIMRQTAENLARTAEDRRLFIDTFKHVDLGDGADPDGEVQDAVSTPDMRVWGDPCLCSYFDGLSRGQVSHEIRAKKDAFPWITSLSS